VISILSCGPHVNQALSRFPAQGANAEAGFLLAGAMERDAARAGTVAEAGHLAPRLAVDFAGGAAGGALRKEVDLTM